ncbi:MAG: phage DNA encapsidation protein [Candidatus Riflebacteria bacterium]|nr:phage DNA encapsidation protein [Candidatus Riflebacteria bacterium]
MANYYDGTKLLSMRDIDGNQPELYLVTSNRTAGKTTWFNRYFVKKFLEKKEKFCLLYRFDYELDMVADKFFKDIGELFFPQYSMMCERRAKGTYLELYIGKKAETDEAKYVSCGYAVSLNKADQVKKLSHLFSDVERMMFDEFQSETNHYCNDEISKFISIHTSIARGQGKQSRYVPVYMLSNPVTIINPYYVELGISDRLQEDTKYLRGHGFVLEQAHSDSATQAQSASGFNKAFSANKYVAYSTQSVYLNDNKAFIDKPEGRSIYLATVRYNGKDFAVRSYPESGCVYCDDNVDSTFKTKLAVTTDDHSINYVMLRANAYIVDMFRYYFDRGCFRFKDLRAKEAIMKAISY